MNRGKLRIDLGNSTQPNWRYITGIVDNDLTCSIYDNNALDETMLEQCKAIHPTFTIEVEKEIKYESTL